MKIPKKVIFKETLLNFEVIFFFIFSIAFLVYIYYTDLDGGAKEIGSITIALGIMLLIWIMVLYTYSIRMLTKITSIIQQEGFRISNFTTSPLFKIEFEKHQKQFILTITSLSIRGTSFEVSPKQTDSTSGTVWKKEVYTRFDSINKLNSILNFAEQSPPLAEDIP